MKKNLIDNLEINEITLPLISQLAERIPGGFFIYHADGNQELIYFNSYLPTIFRCENDEEFKELVRNSFKGMVHPDDYANNEKEILSQIKNSDEKVDHVKYRFVRKDGSVGMIDDYGHFSHSEAFGNIYYVFVQDISDEYERELKQQELGKRIVNQMIGGESTYTINLKNDTFKVINRNRYLEANYDPDEAFSASIGRYIEKDVYEADRDRLRIALSIKNLKRQFQQHNEIIETYRDISTGIAKWYKMRAVRFSNDEIALGFVDYDKEYYDQLIREKLDSEYFGMYVADLDAHIVKIIKSSPFFDAGQTGITIPYMPALLAFANLNSGEAKEFFRNLSDINYINEVFAKENRISFTYKSPVINDRKWVSAECSVLSRHEDGTPEFFSLGFKVADVLASEKNDLQERLNIVREVMEILTEDFGCVNYVEFKENKEDDECISYRTSEMLKKLIPGWESETKFYNKIKLLCNYAVYKPEVGVFYEHVRRERIIGELKDKDSYFVNFKAYFDNDIKFYQMKVSAIRRKGNLIGMVVGIHSVDEYVKKDIANQEKLAEALKNAEVANKSKTKFLFNMSHDIRTPMNAILGFANMAKKNIDDEEKMKDYIEKIEISGQHLLTLINDILEMSRIESGKVEIEENPIDIKAEFNALVTVFSEQAKERGLFFNHCLSDVVHNHVLLDEAKVNSIIINIVGNALKYTPPGGSVFLSIKEVPCDKRGYARFTMAIFDTGIGMSEEYLKTIYEPFSREKNSTVSKIQGTGLGMSIVKELVKLMDGDIKVASRLGEGTRFDLTFDFRIDTKVAKKIDEETNDNSFSLKGLKALVVDDNDLNREIAIDMLQEIGLFVDDVDDGNEAVNKIQEKGPDYYDFVLMDIQMPIMNGYEATKEIRKLFPKSNLPIIALSANAFAEDKAASLACGMNDHVAKPIKVFELMDCLRKHIKK